MGSRGRVKLLCLDPEDKICRVTNHQKPFYQKYPPGFPGLERPHWAQHHQYVISAPISNPAAKTNTASLVSRRHNRITTNADGWSNIVGKGRTPLRMPSELAKPQNSLSTSPTPTYTSWHPTALKNLHTASSALHASSLWETLTSSLASTPATGISKIVVLGLGSLHGATYTSSFLQLSLAVALSELLKAKLYLQDPAFSTADTHFMEELGAAVLVDPEAQKHIDGNAMLFAPHLEYEVLQSALKSRPKVLLANDLREFVDMKRNAEKEYPEFLRCLQECDVTVLTGVNGSEDIGNGRAFNHTALYLRREAQVPTAEKESKIEEAEEGTTNTKKKRNRNRNRKKTSEVKIEANVDLDDVVEGMNSIAL